MTIITPTPIATLPTPPVKGQVGFNSACETYFNALVNPFTPQINAAITATNANAISASVSAAEAAAAAAVANAKLWASGIYLTGAAAISPASIAANNPCAYIRKAPGGASPTDPQNDPTNWVKYLVQTGLGGVIYNSSSALSNISPGAICVYGAQEFQGGASNLLIMPNAMTCNKAAVLFNAYNKSLSDLSFDNFTRSSRIGWLRSNTAAVIGLADNAAQDGVWVDNLEKQGITWNSASNLTTSGCVIKAIIELNRDLSIIIFCGAAGVPIHAMVRDRNGIGSAYLIATPSSVPLVSAVKSGDNKVLVSYFVPNTGLLSFVEITEASGVISVGSPSVTTISTYSVISDLIKVGNSFVLSYSSGNTGYILPIYIVSGTILLGTPTAMPDSNSSTDTPRLYVSGNVVMCVYYSGTTIYCHPYTIAAATATSGTRAAAAGMSFEPRTFESGGYIWAIHGADYKCTIFKLTGTVVTGSSVLPFTNIVSSGKFDVSVLSATKIAICAITNTNAATGEYKINIIVNTNGVPSAGTQYARQMNGLEYVSSIITKNNNIFSGFLVESQTHVTSQIVVFDSYGASPIINDNIVTTGRHPLIGGTKNKFNEPLPNVFYADNYVYVFTSTGYFGFNTAGVHKPYKIPISPIGVPNFRGLRGSAYSSYYIGAATTSGLGIRVQKIEVI